MLLTMTGNPGRPYITLSVAGVESVLANLDTTKATDPDEISARLLKETAPVISTSLCSLYNKSLNQGVFPQEWKIANIVPVYKKVDKEYVENYRPISPLCIVSKVFERCVLNNIREHIYQEIKTSQHGFTRGKSCVTDLLEALNYIGSVLDTGGQIDTVYLDVSKAFDIVNHKSLLLKLQSIGIGGSLLQWFQSYLANREQRVTWFYIYQFTSDIQASLRVPYLVLYCLACMLMIFLMPSHLVTLQCLRMILNSLRKSISPKIVNCFKMTSTNYKHGLKTPA